MADKDQYNDEYQFADLDAMTPDIEEGVADGEGAGTPPSEEPRPTAYRAENNIKRNALIVVVVVIAIMVIYKIVGAVHSEKKVTGEASVPPAVVPTPAPPPAPKPVLTQPITAPPVMPTPQVNEPKINNQIDQKLSALEVGQQSMRSDITSVSSQMSGINNNLNTIATKITELNGIIANLTAKLDDQAHEIERLTIHKEVRKPHYTVRKSFHATKYYIQAVIPGRAWLIATNGSTLTVREGTIIAGYGMVKLIDPNQGRVITSSGRVIGFSQEDS